jgi:hypothetical protein
VAGYAGLRLGQPVTEAEIIRNFAAFYVAEQAESAALTDCIATPDLRPDIRLVVRCTHPHGTTYSYYSGARGERLAAEDIQEPQV